MKNFSWTDAAHYGASLVCLALAGLTEIGVQLPGVTVDPKVAGAAGIGILAAGLKGGITSGKTVAKIFLVACAAALAYQLAVPAHAADLATKAPPLATLNQPYPTSGCGLYYGINAEAGAGTVNDSPTVGATVIGGDVGGLLGYACAGSVNWFVEGIADFQNLNGNASGFSLTGPAHLEQRAGVETPLVSFLSSFFGSTGTPLSFAPLLPPGVTASGTPQNYVYAALNEDDISASLGLATAHQWLVSPELGTGLLTALSDKVVADTYAGVELQSDAICIGGAACPKLATRFKVGVSFKY